MAEPFIGQIQPFAFGFATRNWVLCNGQILPIAQYAALFSLLGTSFGGDGQTTFGLPDLRGRVPMHFGTSSFGTYVPGEQGGAETVALTLQQIPAHTHAFMGSSGNASALNPTVNAALAKVQGPAGKTPYFYGAFSGSQQLNAGSIGSTVGGNQPHSNIQPYLTINWCIATVGTFPTRN